MSEPRDDDARVGASDLGRLIALARPYARPLVAATAIMLLGSAAALAAPRLAGSVVDAALVERSLHQLDLVVLALVGLFLVRGALDAVEHYLVAATGARFLRDLRQRLFDHLLVLTPAFYDQRRLGELMSRLSSDLTRVQATLTAKLPAGVQASVSLVGTLAVLLVMNARLTLLALSIIPPIVLLSMAYGRRLQRLARRVQDSLAATSADAEQALAGIRTVQAFGREDLERTRYARGLAALLGLERQNARVTGVFYGVLSFVGFGAFALVLWYGGRLIHRGELTPGELTAFLLYAFQIAAQVASLGALYVGLRELGGASARVFELVDTVPTVTDRPGARALARCRGEVELDGVGFRYPGAARDAVSEVSLRVAPGELVALVGPSGAGKSSLFHLLYRFHDPERGALRLDGVELTELTLASLRAQLAVVPQDIFLFHGTVADNIGYGVVDADRAAIEAAARQAGAADFIAALPRGYDEIVGERGVKLSAGQRQRLAIARAFLRQPRVLLLDEATSALDAESEEVVQRALDALMAGRTTLVIAHRLATARKASRIAVMDDGRIVALGRHDELMTTSPLYRRYWQLQALAGGPEPGVAGAGNLAAPPVS